MSNAIRSSLRKAGLHALAGVLRARVPTVLMYHSIDPDSREFFNVTPGEFKRQLQFFRDQNYEILSMDEVADALEGRRAFPNRAVCLTFDDGYRDNLTTALPILEAFGAKAAIYFPTQYVEEGRSDKGHAVCSRQEVKALSKHPLITVAAHTVTHAKLAGLPEESAWWEIQECKKRLEDWIQKPVVHFAYPKGDYADPTARLVEKAGYRTAVTIEAGDLKSTRDLFRIPRISVDSGMTYPLFRLSTRRGTIVYEKVAGALCR